MKKLILVILSVIIAIAAFLMGIWLGGAKPTDDSMVVESMRANYRIYAVPLPRQLSFAGEDALLNDYDVRERIDKELLTNTYWQSNTLLYFKRAFRFFPIIEKILAEEQVPTDFKYLAVAESGLQNVVSPAGAAGYWQFLKNTALQYGLEVNDEVDERYHLEKSTYAACKYLKDSYKRFGSWSMVAAAYNMGNAGLQRQSENQSESNYYNLYLNTETSKYLPRILAIKVIMEQPALFGFQFRPADLYAPILAKNIEVNASIPDLYVFAKEQNVTYKHLKLLNPWLRKTNLPNKSGKTYAIAIAEKTKLQPITEWPNGFKHWSAANPVGVKFTENTDIQSKTPIRKPKLINHIVGSNENLSQIANQYQTNVSELIHLNNLNSNQIKRGQVIQIMVP